MPHSIEHPSAASHPLHALFHPATVAVVGASSDPKKIGNRICRQLLAEGYQGTLVPVNQRGQEVAGVASVTNIRKWDGPVDVAVITTATDQVREAITDCAAHGVRFAVVHTAGFAETGPEGKALEDEIVQIARKAGMRLVGPNCMQMFNASASLNLIGTPFPRGRIAMISQSGNLIRAVTEEFEQSGLGFSKFVSVGNQADLMIQEYLDYLRLDPDTRAIILYIEGLKPGTGRALIEGARRVTQTKPIVIMKGATTDAGARSAVSHTGSLGGHRRVFEAAMAQAGVLIAQRFDEFVPMADALSRLPTPKGRRFAVIGGGGGHVTISADALEKEGLVVPPFSPGAQKKIAALLPPRAAIANPVDFTGGSEREIAIHASIPEIAFDDGMDGAIVCGLYAGYRLDLEFPGNTYVETSRLIGDLVRRSGKPIVLQSVYARRDHPSLAVLREEGVPTTDSVEQAAHALAALALLGEYRRRPLPAPPAPPQGLTIPEATVRRALMRPQRNLTESESLAFLDDAGIAAVPSRLAASADEAVAAADALGYPVVLKASSAEIVHKSDIGGVALDLRDATAVRAAHARIAALGHGGGALVAAYRPGGLELLIGAYRDACFGPVIMVGLGGIFVEALDDVVVRVGPVDRREAGEMLGGLKAHRLLGAIRGRPPRDLEALIDMIVAVGGIMEACPLVAELDLNPVLAFEKGAFAADARIILTD